MSLLDIVGELFLLGSKESERRKTNPPKILIAFYFLLIVSVVWLAAEAKSIANLQSPFLFLLFFGSTGIVLSFIIMYLLWQAGLIEFFTKQFAFIILVALLSLTIASASFINTSKSKNGKLGFDLSTKP